jgi:hypothetical protein
MRYDTIRLRRFAGSSTPRAAWRGWAGPATASVVDSDLATMLDRRDDAECGLRTPGRWRRRRW